MQVIVHTQWMGQPPSVIEDQVSYPIVTTLLAAPRVKAVRAQTMANDSYVFVIFEDGTDIYWARSRVLEYLQGLAGKLPPGVAPMLGPDATGAGWVYEYVLLDRTHRMSLADLRSLQDWNVRYALETVPGVAEVASIGGFVRQYQVRLDPNRLLALHVPLETVIDKIRDSNNEVGGRVIEMSGASYNVLGLGYINSAADLEQIAVATSNGTPVLIRDLGMVTRGLGPARRFRGMERGRRDRRRNRNNALRPERARRYQRRQGEAGRAAPEPAGGCARSWPATIAADLSALRSRRSRAI